MENGLALVEVAPGIDPAKDILRQMDFPIVIPPGIPSMDPTFFREG
jgi:acyl CoA:acetate/3-ketoacid CoA transferase